MKFKTTFIALSVSATLFSGMASAAITGTSSVQMDFQTKVIPGTCTAKVVNGAGAESSEIAFGDVYKSDLVNKTRVEPLKISLTNCSGVEKATVSVASADGPKKNCSGQSGTGSSFAAGLATGFEIWSGVVDTGLLMNCNTPPAPQEVTITDGAGEFPMNSRIVIAEGRNISQVGTGAVNAALRFTVDYQ